MKEVEKGKISPEPQRGKKYFYVWKCNVPCHAWVRMNEILSFSVEFWKLKTGVFGIFLLKNAEKWKNSPEAKFQMRWFKGEWNQKEMKMILFEGRYQVLKFFFARGSSVPFYAGVVKKNGTCEQKKTNFRSERQEPSRWSRWDFMTLIVITLMLLLGIYQNFIPFHLEIRF